MGRAFAEGRLTERELLLAQAAKTASDQSVRAADYHRITAEAHFNRLLARPLDSPVLLEEVAIPKHSCSFEELQHIATSQRADVSQLESILRSRIYDAERLRRETNPQVAVVGRLGYEENRFQTPQAIGSAAVVLDWNFFDGSRSRALADAELSRAASVGRLIEDLRSQISLELLTAWNDREEAAYRTTATWQSLQQSEEHLRVLTLRHQQGLNVQSDVLDAHAQRTRTAKDYHAARYDLTEAQLRLRHAAGILGQ
jgi:outer membrane protein